jgi:thiol-disulfide isomerase/thioredoxin
MVRPPCGRCPAAATIALAILSFGLPARSAEILMLDFWSPQCPPCMQMKPIVHSLEQANYPIRQVDTMRDSQLAQQYGVTGIPCFVMLVDGREVDREVGYTSSERLQQMFQKAKDEVVRMRGVRGQSPDPRTMVSAPSLDRTTAAGPAPKLEGQPAAQQYPWKISANDAKDPAVVAQPGAVVPQSIPAGVSADFPSSLIAATVRIRVEDPQGRSFGTGTIIDSRSGEALVVTCGHLFRESKGKGTMTIELFDVGPNGLQVATQVPGQLISCDLDRDVAFVSIKPNRQVSVAPVAPPRTPIQQGDRVATIGCSNGKDPTLLPQRITKLDRYQGPANIEVSGAPEEGRSGGGLFNLQGQLIGVCYAADYEGNEGLYAALESIHEELARLNLKDIYVKARGASDTRVAVNPPAAQPRILFQEERDPVTPIGGLVPTSSTDPKTAFPEGLNETEQAAFDEIMQRGVESEVIIIVRPKTPSGQSETLMLDNVSPEFVKALAERQRKPQAPVTR